MEVLAIGVVEGDLPKHHNLQSCLAAAALAVDFSLRLGEEAQADIMVVTLEDETTPWVEAAAAGSVTGANHLTAQMTDSTTTRTP